MLIDILRSRGLYLAGEEGAGGAGAAVLDAPAGEEGAEGAADEGAEAGAEGAEAEGAEGKGEGEETAGAGERAEGTGRTFTDSDMAKMRRGMEASFDKKLQQATEALRLSLTGEVSTIRKDVDTLKPPEKDSLEVFFDKLPEGVDPSQHPDAKKEDQEAFALKQDAGLMLRVMKHPEFRRALLGPILPVIQQMFRSLDLNSWQTEQAMEALGSLTDVEFGQPELDAEGKVVKAAAKLGDKLPVGFKHRDRVVKQHREQVEKSGGRWVPVRDVFAAVQQQLRDEDAAAGKAAGAAATQATARTLRELGQRRSAPGTSGNAAPAPRGGPAKGQKRTFSQIEDPNFNARVP